MRVITLNKTGSLKARTLPAELFLSDLETSVKSFAPGEWVKFLNPKRNEFFVGFVNPMVQSSAPCGYALLETDKETPTDVAVLLSDLLERAVQKRSLTSDYGMNARMVYGTSDRLPGLIADSFENCALAQINTAGLDAFREQIKKKLEDMLQRPVYLLDNPAYRMAEGLPVFERDWEAQELRVREGDLLFSMSGENLQKVGFYYDHRENRKKLRDYIGRLPKKPRKGADLFCYAGAWGMSMAKAGVESVDFVDQGDFADTVRNGWKANNLAGELSFTRQDVFDYLKAAEKEGKSYDVIVSDPPAFCKSQKGAKKALEGYTRLHRSCFRLLADKSFFAACSCTHYVDMDAFAQNVATAARQERVSLTMLDLGTQAFDHPSSSLKDRSNYLKYILYYVEKL